MEKRNRKNNEAAELMFVLFFVSALIFNGCKKSDEQPTSEAAPKIDGDKIVLPANAPQKSSLKVETAIVAGKSITHLNGRLVWNDDATVRVFAPLGGRVEHIDATLGQTVKAGDTLATLSSPDFGQAQADANRAAADLKLSERTLARLRDLLAHGAAAQKDVEAAEDDFESKRAENERAHARLEQYGVKLGVVNGMFPLKSPIDGVVVEKNINPGQEIRPDAQLANDPKLVAPLFVISDPSRLTVLLDVTELEIGSLKAGQRFQIRTKAYPDKVFEGYVQFIGDTLDPQTRTVKARGEVKNSDRLLKAEMYVAVEVADDVEPGKNAAPQAVTGGDRPRFAREARVEIPVSAVFSKENQHFVFIEKKPGEFYRQPVQIGRERDGKVCVLDGLAPGARVVTTGGLLLQAMTEAAKE